MKIAQQPGMFEEGTVWVIRLPGGRYLGEQGKKVWGRRYARQYATAEEAWAVFRKLDCGPGGFVAGFGPVIKEEP
jgi:hypothetical protein